MLNPLDFIDIMVGQSLLNDALTRAKVTNDQIKAVFAKEGLVDVTSQNAILSAYKAEVGNDTFAQVASSPAFLTLLKDYVQELREKNFATVLGRLKALLPADAFQPGGLNEQDLRDFVLAFAR